MSEQQKQSRVIGLQYFIAEKNGVMIVSLVGKLVRDHSLVLEKCQKDVLSSPAKWVIFNFREVSPEMDKLIVPHFARIQKMIREKPASLRLASIHPELSRFLESQGLVRAEELANNLTEALKTLSLIQAMSA